MARHPGECPSEPGASDHVLEELLAERWTPVRETAAAFSARIGCVVWLILLEKGAAAG